MITSTDGQICYGVAFEEGFEFPWGDGEIEDWWSYTVHGFNPSFELFDADGNYLNGREPSKDEIRRYFEERQVFDAAHSLPVSLVNYCSGDYPMYALVVPISADSFLVAIACPLVDVDPGWASAPI